MTTVQVRTPAADFPVSQLKVRSYRPDVFCRRGTLERWERGTGRIVEPCASAGRLRLRAGTTCCGRRSWASPCRAGTRVLSRRRAGAGRRRAQRPTTNRFLGSMSGSGYVVAKYTRSCPFSSKDNVCAERKVSAVSLP